MATETEAQGAAGATETVSPDEFSDLLKQSFKLGNFHYSQIFTCTISDRNGICGNLFVASY